MPAVEVTAIINLLNILQLCKNLLSLLRKKSLVVMLFRLILLILLRNLGHYSERVSRLGLIVIVDSIKEEDDFVELKTNDDEK